MLMETQILDGYQLAEEFHKKLKSQLSQLNGKLLVVAAILFSEDKGSQLYTQLKKEMAESLGIEYRVFSFSVKDNSEEIVKKLKDLNEDLAITGIIIQKPWRKTWLNAHNIDKDSGKEQFDSWWHSLVSELNPEKDVDGLHPSNLEALKTGDWRAEGRVLPATCQATIRLLEKAFNTQHLFADLRNNNLKIVIIGKSDLLGLPLFTILSSKRCDVEMIGSKELKERIEQQKFLKDADVLVTATGRKDLIKGSMIKEDCVIIDVGEPQGDVEQSSVIGVAKALTPVPGGVGPMTVVSLMENAIYLGNN
jgi:methylenetetrahydrofolate dehydrogenase (NADP+)/methenyltetrahydrofolate cyclohydrolase